MLISFRLKYKVGSKGKLPNDEYIKYKTKIKEAGRGADKLITKAPTESVSQVNSQSLAEICIVLNLFILKAL